MKDTPPTSKHSRWTKRIISLGVIYLLCALSVGIISGLGVFTFGYGKGASYLSNNPQSCANCHVMQDYLDTWQKSSHHNVATCNDCHLSHHPVGKWVTKADNGFFHSLAFTLDNYHKPIEIKDRNREVTQDACIHCHAETSHPMLSIRNETETLHCARCHSDVGHSLRR
ncbi:cytochrome c nitrite reductase small subunit [Puniceicoccaceae bacterium K14]|nr:cytochrome c nitrite reductase small subunit [Puniceicoccaceae bacterium K14]